MLHVRIDERLKERGNAVLEAIGLTAADAVRLLYHRLIAEQGFPLELKVPNEKTRAAMAEAEAIAARRQARFADAEQLFTALEATDLEAPEKE
jgi:DNA-damage-inducible protein J